MARNTVRLRVDERQQLFLAAARGLSSGMDNIQTLNVLPLPEALQNTLKKRIQRGESLSSAGYSLGVFNQREQQILRIGEKSGALEAMLEFLEQFYGHWHQLYLSVRSQLLYPIALVALALAITPFLSAIKAQEPAMNAIPQSLIGVLVWGWVCRRLFKRLRFHQIGVWPVWWFRLSEYRLREHLPGRMVERDFMLLFATLTDAGVDYGSALNYLAFVLGGEYKSRCLEATQRAKAGGGIVNALRDAGLILSPSNLNLLRIAEQAGRFPGELKRLALLLSRDIAEDQKFVFTWLGRLVYLIVLLQVGRLITA